MTTFPNTVPPKKCGGVSARYPLPNAHTSGSALCVRTYTVNRVVGLCGVDKRRLGLGWYTVDSTVSIMLKKIKSI